MIPVKYVIQGFTNLILDKISDIKYKKYFDERLDICKSCEFNKHNFCQHCGCFVPAKTKAEDSACPVKKWDTISNTIAKKES